MKETNNERNHTWKKPCLASLDNKNDFAMLLPRKILLCCSRPWRKRHAIYLYNYVYTLYLKKCHQGNKKAFHVYFSFNKKIPWIIFQPQFCTCTWVATRSSVRKVSRKLLDGISRAEDEDGRIREREVHLELQHVYACHWGEELHLVTSGPWPSSHRAALQN